MFIALPATLHCQELQRNLVAYYTSWSIYARDYHVMDLPAEQITHINYAFANISDGQIILGDAYADIDRFYEGDSWDPDSLRGNFHQLMLLKAEHPHLKTLISVGGWTWSNHFSDVAATEDSRALFAASCADFVEQYFFDGVDIDWEYPVEGGEGDTGHRPEDRENYTLLMQAIRASLDSLESENGREYLLSIAASANPDYAENIEVEEMCEVLDFINLMTYDFHGPWNGEGDPVTCFNAALHPATDNPIPEPYHSMFNLAATVQLYDSLGAPSEKLNAGVPFYGRGYAGVENENNGLFADYTGPSNGTWENGVFDYYDLEDNYINMNGFVRYWHDEAMVPWLYNPTNSIMISYDDSLSIALKGYYIAANGLGGAMYWESSGDRDGVLVQSIHYALQRASLHVSPDQLDFGYVQVGNSMERDLLLTNMGGEELTVDMMIVDNEFFDFDDLTPFTLQPGGVQVIPVSFEPLELINYYGLLQIASTDPVEPLKVVEISGTGVLLPQPFSLTANLNEDNGMVQLEWEFNPGGPYDFDGFEVYRDSSWIGISDVEVFVDQLTETGIYDYYVVAAYEEGDSFPSNTVTVEWAGNRVDDKPGAIPERFEITSVYPNPFNSTVSVRYSLPDAGRVMFSVVDVTGREVFSQQVSRAAGYHSVSVDGAGLASGVYVVTVSCRPFGSRMEKVVLVK